MTTFSLIPVNSFYTLPDKDFGLRYRSPNNINWARRRTIMYDLLGFLPPPGRKPYGPEAGLAKIII